METEFLTADEISELRLPKQWDKAELEWSGIPAQLECSVCQGKITRTLNVPPNVSLEKIPFTCKGCTSKRRGRPRKSPLNGQREPSPVEKVDTPDEEVLRPLSAALAGFAPVLDAGLAPAALPAY